MALTTIATGLSGLKAAAEMTKMLRDGLRAGQVKAEDIAPRIGEIYDYIIDSKAALYDAQEQLGVMNDRIRQLIDNSHIAEQLISEGSAYFRMVGDKKVGPFCTACWDDTQKLVRITYGGLTKNGGGWFDEYRCPLHPKHPFLMSPRPAAVAP
jgi:hypothetical protein